MPLQYNPTESRFLTVAQSRTNNGQKDIRIILDIPTNDFYSLDDDGNFTIIGGGGISTLADVLSAGNSTGNNQIFSPDGLSQLSIIDGFINNNVTDNLNYQTYIQTQPDNNSFYSVDLNTNDYNNLIQYYYAFQINNVFNSGLSTNSIIVDTNGVYLQHFTSPSQLQKIFVDADSCNMTYDDSINSITLELGLTNGFFARNTDNANYNNLIQIKFDEVKLGYENISSIISYSLQLNDNGFLLKNLPVYADDADAGTNGLPQGYLYQTDGTGASPLDVAGILMVKQ